MGKYALEDYGFRFDDKPVKTCALEQYGISCGDKTPEAPSGQSQSPAQPALVKSAIATPSPQTVAYLGSDGAMTQSDSSVFAGAGVVPAVMAGLFCAYVLWVLLGKSVEGTTPIATGRRWMNRLVVAGSIPGLVKLFSILFGNRDGNASDALAMLLLPVPILGAAVFVLGALWAYVSGQKANGSVRPEPTGEASVVNAGLTEKDAKSTVVPTEPAVEEVDWAEALLEFDAGNRRAGLWAKSFSDANGNDDVAKAKYLRLRAKEIASARRVEFARIACEAKLKAREDALADLDEEALAYERLQKRVCPNCDALIPLAFDPCPKCRWRIRPLPAA